MNDGTDEDFGNDDHGHHEENESCRAVYGQCDSQREKRRGQEWVGPPSSEKATRENCAFQKRGILSAI